MPPSDARHSVNPMPMLMPLHVAAGSWVPSAMMSAVWRNWLAMESQVAPLQRLGSKLPATACIMASVSSRSSTPLMMPCVAPWWLASRTNEMFASWIFRLTRKPEVGRVSVSVTGVSELQVLATRAPSGRLSLAASMSSGSTKLPS